jgi:hypothetical protein
MIESNDVSAALQQAIQAGEVLTIKYHGGSQPGAERQIAPMEVNGDKVRARCYASNAVKYFMLGKIELLTSHVPTEAVAWNRDAIPIVLYGTIPDIRAKHISEFQALGWHVESDKNFITLHRVRKNGNPLKGPDVSLLYEEWITDFEWDIDIDDVVETPPRKSKRPYLVRAKKHDSITYSIFAHAVERFLHFATLLAPNQKEQSTIK